MTPSALFVGLMTLDVIHAVDAALAPNEKAPALRQDIAAGGPAANAAVTFAALGGTATLLTAAGGHPLARAAAGELLERDVAIVDATPAAVLPPAVSLIRVVESTGERSVSSVNAAGVDAPPPARLDRLVSGSDIVLVDGHHPELATAAVASARAAGVPVVLDGGSWKPILERLLPDIDMAICSADFIAPDGLSTVDSVLGYGVASVAVTHGAASIVWATREDSGLLPVPHVPVRDTSGAGDAFHGAAVYALAGAADWPSALRFATRIAGVRVQYPGPREWLAALTSN
jgi:sugar/nucleoside kinase (ribokinase family)